MERKANKKQRPIENGKIKRGNKNKEEINKD